MSAKAFVSADYPGNYPGIFFVPNGTEKMNLQETHERILKARENIGHSEQRLLFPWVNKVDIGAPWLSKGTYLWYYAFGVVIAPKRILEIGTRYGYSVMSMWKGADESGGVEEIFCVDSGLDFSDWADHVNRIACEKNMIDGLVGKKPTIFETVSADTQAKKDPSFLGNQKFDLCHVDADHSYHGCIHDCMTCLEVTKPGGWIIVDDTTSRDVNDAATVFARMNGLNFFEIGSPTGQIVIQNSR
jgi:predicted O-methyltransferase YrrM